MGLITSSNSLIYAGGKGNKNIYQLNPAQNGWIQIGEMAQRRYFYPALTMSESICRGEKIEGKPTSTLLESGTLQSPNFPNKYPNNHDETYNIEVQTGKTIEIIFETFELEAHSRCSWDWLKIIDGSTTLLEETCGSNVPAKLLSQTNKVEIIFHSDYVVPKRGFKLQWKASIKNYCRTNVKDALDVAKLPECCNDVDTLLDYGGCCKDIFDGKEEACYIDPKQDTRSVSRSSSRYSTYSIYWCQSKILKDSDLQTYPICCLNPFISGKFKEDPEFIRQCCAKFDLCTNKRRLQSPNFPNKYPNNHDETYNIEVQTGKTIEIIFETFELEAHSRCSYDWLKIIDGSTTLLEETCGSNVPSKMISQTNKVEIIFHTDGSVTKRGFKLQWKAFIESTIENYCRTNVKDALDVAELPECCNNADILLDYGGCCKDLFDGEEEACYIDPKQDTTTTTTTKQDTQSVSHM